MNSAPGKPMVSDLTQVTECVSVQINTSPGDWESAGFNRIEVWRSTVSPAGPYEALTAPQWAPAVLPNSAGLEPEAPVAGKQLQLAGTQLLLRVDGTYDVAVSFNAPGYAALAQAASEITAQSGGLLRAYVDATGLLVLVGIRPGSAASLEITGGDAAALLGLPTVRPDSLAYGRDAHLRLLPGVQQYTFQDFRGSRSYFYRTRLIDTVTGSQGAFSLPFIASQGLGITQSNVMQGFVDLVGIDGRPLVGQLVQVYARTQPALVEGKLVTGSQQVRTTDTQGRAQFTLVRGVQYTVSISGTDLSRGVLAPTDPSVTAFNLLAGAVGVQDDLFTVDRPPMEYAERRSL